MQQLHAVILKHQVSISPTPHQVDVHDSKELKVLKRLNKVI